MERICGKHSQEITTDELIAHIATWPDTLIDLGTGDGRFALHVARANPVQCVIGIDACRDNLREASRRAPANALFLIANACTLPTELAGVASAITINFPWGTLLTGLLDEDTPLLATVASLARPGATLEIRLNGGALAEAGWSLESGGQQAQRLARLAGFRMAAPRLLVADDLRAHPTTWAKRLAFGRDPHALYLAGSYQTHQTHQTHQTPSLAVEERGSEHHGTRILDEGRRRAAG
jgi:16S rRNA (adenine(1408)-N(1))-methyltransferase